MIYGSTNQIKALCSTEDVRRRSSSENRREPELSSPCRKIAGQTGMEREIRYQQDYIIVNTKYNCDGIKKDRLSYLSQRYVGLRSYGPQPNCGVSRLWVNSDYDYDSDSLSILTILVNDSFQDLRLFDLGLEFQNKMQI